MFGGIENVRGITRVLADHRVDAGGKPVKHSGQVVLITGGGSGIGLALARKFHGAANRVVLVGRSAVTLAQAAAALPGVETFVADVARDEDRERLVDCFGDTTVLVNNAGIQVNGMVTDSTPDEIEHELSVNFLAPVLLTHAFLPRLVQHPNAVIVNVSSGLALVPKKSAAIYCASKAALHSFSKTLRWQLDGTGVRVVEVLPPLVDTAMTAGRGKGKISADALADEFWQGFVADHQQMLIGKTKLLALLNRVAPSVAERIMRSM